MPFSRVRMIPALHSISMNNSELFVKNNSSTSFFVEFLESIFGCHVLSGEVALFELEVATVFTQEFRENVALYLHNIVVNSVPKHKISFIGRMCVKI